MPIYEFICQDCNKTFDLLCSLKTDLSTVKCEHCSGGNVQKKVSRFATGASNTKSFDLGEGGGQSSGGGCGSCSSGSCGTCGH